LIDFRYLTDCITPDEALALLRERAAGKAERLADLLANGYPCYTTSAGWLGYDDAKLRRLTQQSVDDGFKHIKLKVGRDVADDIRRLRIVRDVLGPDLNLMIDGQPGVGRRAGDRAGLGSSRSPGPGSSRSPPAPTTSRATDASARR